MVEICQDSLPVMPWMAEATRRLPGLQPVLVGDWLRVDEVYAPQMKYRAELIANRRSDVYRMANSALGAAEELLDLVLASLQKIEGFRVDATQVVCPDGRTVALDRSAPLITCGHLVQEDFNILQMQQDQHVLTGSILCFPASWSLQEKFFGKSNVDPQRCSRV